MKRPLVPVVICFGLGIVIAEFCRPAFSLVTFTALVFLLGLILSRRKMIIFQIILFMIFISLGAIYTQAKQSLNANHINDVAKFSYGQEVALKGIVISDVEKRESFQGHKTILTLEVKELQTPSRHFLNIQKKSGSRLPVKTDRNGGSGWQEKTGKILVHIFRDYDVSYGDDISLKGKFHRPFNFETTSKFSYRDYLRYRGIEWIFSVKKAAVVEILSLEEGNRWQKFFYQMRHRFDDLLEQYLSKNEASIMTMMLLGDRSQIPQHIRDLFVHTGTAHVLAISGLHVTLIAGLFLILMRLLPIGRKAQLIAAIVLVIFYALLTGGRPSVVRATIMSIVFLIGFLVERDTDSLNNLSLAALIILLIDPLSLFDIGFQLSFMCVLWIILFVSKVKAGLTKILGNPQGKIWPFFISSLIVSIVALLGVTGLIAYYFSTVTPVAILANLMIVPLSGVVIALGMGLVVIASLWPSAAFVFAHCLKITLNVMTGITFLFDKIPYGYFVIKNVSFLWTLSYYVVVTALFVLPWGRIFRFSKP